MKTQERHPRRSFNVFILNLRWFPQLFLVFQLLILNRQLFSGKGYKAQPLKSRSYLSFNFANIKICVMIRLAKDRKEWAASIPYL